MKTIRKRFGRFWLVTGIVSCLVAGLWMGVQADGTPLSVAGYLDFPYNTDPVNPLIVNDPTGEKPESKLWWNDGFWWGSLMNAAAGRYHIYRFNWGTQTWEDTGVPLDTRPDTKADVLWDQANSKLYVVSHLYADLGSKVNQPVNYGKFFRYTYNPLTQSYTLDAGFPNSVNVDKGETLVIAQERSNPQNLWVTYVSSVPPSLDYHVYVNRSTNSGDTWGTPVKLPFLSEATTGQSDIASIIGFRDNGGNKIGVMWMNSLTQNLYFATIADGQDPAQAGNWTLATISVPNGPDDHINLKSLHTTSTGHLFAAIKTAAPITDPTAPEIGLIVRNNSGNFDFHTYSLRSQNDTRPISVLEEGADPNSTADDKVYVFVTGKPGGSKVCYKSLPVDTLINDPSSAFAAGDCGTTFIEDPTYNFIDNATSSKHNVNATTGLLIEASNSVAPRYYVHNVMGNPPPVVTSLIPTRAMTDVVYSSVIQVSFSKSMNLSTFNSSTFMVDDGTGPVAGTLTIDASGLVVTFQPSASLKAATTYTVKLTNGILDNTGQALFQRTAFASDPVIREQWSFTTAAPTVQFSAASFSVAENGVTATITATLNMTSSLAATVNYATSDGTAFAGMDYTATSGTLTFNPGETVKTFTVAVSDDATNDGNLSANLTLSSPVNANLSATPTVPLIILDDDGPPTVQFSAIAYTVAENDASGKATITVNLSHADPGIITVDYAISDGTANGGGVDYTATNGTLTFNPNETSKTFDITLNNETMFEADETVNVALGTVVPGTVLVSGPNPVVLTIQNDDAEPAVQFGNATYSADEEPGPGATTVQLTNPSAFPVTVNVATSDGTAQASADYTAISTTLTFAPEQTSQPFNVALLSDLTDEADESVNLGLSNATGATVGAQASALLTIVDNDDPPTVQFAAATYTVGEGASSGTATINLSLSAASGKVVTVDYTLSNGTATDGSDYTLSNGTVTFDPGQTTQTFVVHLLDDAIDELDETVLLTLNNSPNVSPVNATLGTQTNATLTINDNDSTPTVQFGTVANVTEDAGTATVTVVLSAPSGKTVTVGYATTAGGTATGGGVDYTAASGTLTFNEGQTSQTFTVPVIQDTLDEPNETVNLALSSPTNASLGTPANAPLIIVDDDGAPTVQFGASTYTVNEDGDTATISVQLSNVAGQAVTVAYATSNGTATEGSDYTAASGTVTFNPGETSQSFTVAIADDDEDDDSETINLALSSPQNAALADPSTATLTIIDNENTLTVQFSAASFTVNEGDGTATITVILSNASDGEVTVQYATSAGNATAGSDYTETSGKLTFVPGDIEESFTVPVIDDADDEAPETVNLTLSNPTNATRGTQRNAELTIVDNDGAPTVQFSAATYSVNEDDTTTTITVELSNAASQAVSVDYGTGNVDAVAGIDYEAAVGTLTFAPGETSKTFTVEIHEDTLDEPNETLNLGLSNAINVELGAPTTAVLTILDDDVTPPTVQFSAATYTVNENAGTATITVNVSGELLQAVTVDYATSAGTATGGGVDYTGANGTLTFDPSETSKTFTVAIVDDTADEQDETINLALSNPANAVLGTRVNATLTIIDNDVTVIAAPKLYLPIIRK